MRKERGEELAEEEKGKKKYMRKEQEMNSSSVATERKKP